jgi:hypothetical protein
VHSFKEPIDSKRLKLTSTCHFLLKLDVRGSDSHKHSHFTKVGKSQQRIKVLVQGESTTLSSQMIGKAISELMHQEDATCDQISRTPSQHDLLLQRVRSPQLPYMQGITAAPALKSTANTGAPYSELHPMKCNKLTECPLEFVTSSQDLVPCSLMATSTIF